MKLLLRIALVLFIWIVIIALLLEVGLRAMADNLPPRFAIAANHVLQGEQFEVNKVTYMQTNGDSGYALLPDLDSVRQQVSPSISFEFSTLPLWGSDIGFRNRYVDYLVETVVVGDSFSFCFTALEDCWVTHYEQDTGLGTVNLSQPGTASYSHLRLLEKYATPLEPRLVLWQFFGNDFNEDYGFAISRGEVDAPEDANTLTVPEDDIQGGIIQWLRDNSLAFAVIDVAFGNDWAYMTGFQRLFDEQYTVNDEQGPFSFGQPYELQVFDMSDPRNQAGVRYTHDSLAAAKELVSGWGGHLAVILIPTRELVYSQLTEPIMGDSLKIHNEPRETMLAICEALELLCFDPLPQLQQYAQAGERLYYDDDLHLNPRGNEVLSEMIWRWLGGNGILYEN